MKKIKSDVFGKGLLFFSILLYWSAHGNSQQTRPLSVILPCYHVSVLLIPDARRIEVTGTMQLPPTTSARDKLQLSLSELMQDLRVEVVRPAISAGATKLDRELRAYSRPGWGTNTWTIRPSHFIPANEVVVLRFSYNGGGERTSFVFSLMRDVCFAAGITTAWYPEVEEPLPESSPRLRGLRGTGTLDFTVPHGFIAHSEGVQRAMSDENSNGSFRFEITSPVFFSFVAARYKVRQRSSNPPISLYLLHARENADTYLSGAARVIDALTQEGRSVPVSKSLDQSQSSLVRRGNEFAGRGVTPAL